MYIGCNHGNGQFDHFQHSRPINIMQNWMIFFLQNISVVIKDTERKPNIISEEWVIPGVLSNIKSQGCFQYWANIPVINEKMQNENRRIA